MEDTPDIGRKFLIGTSGYSFPDWVGTFYPHDARQKDMLGLYVQHFRTVELNFTFYAVPAATTIARIADATGPDFSFWVKANQKTTHEQDRSVARQFIDSLAPMIETRKLAGVLMQFPQAFHRTAANRQYLADAIDDFGPLPIAVEFRHASWEHPSVVEGLRARRVTLVVPDAPPIRGLYRPATIATSPTGYLRLHSRDAANWYAGMAQRYDYNYSEAELREVAAAWSPIAEQTDHVYAFFNNCHRGQAGQNAQALQRILGQIK
jgi:uncharacterized protein YecE (DUF72 family)